MNDAERLEAHNMIVNSGFQPTHTKVSNSKEALFVLASSLAFRHELSQDVFDFCVSMLNDKDRETFSKMIRKEADDAK